MANDRWTVAVVIPVYAPRLRPSEEQSWASFRHHLKMYDTYLLLPEGLEPDLGNLPTVRFPHRYFLSTVTYSQLLLSPQFYRKFSSYEFILIYQLDCLVFSDDIHTWCEEGFDYLGAPWFREASDPELGLSRVGNGGLSLRKVDSALKALDSGRYVDQKVSLVRQLLLEKFSDSHVSSAPALKRRMRVLREVRRGVDWYTQNYLLNEDHFWSDRAQLFDPSFKVAPVEAGLRFSFEQHPEYCYTRNDRRLPFGCHAWRKWGNDFWKPFLGAAGVR